MGIEAFVKAATEVAKEVGKETGNSIKSFDSRKPMENNTSTGERFKTTEKDKRNVDVEKRIPKDKSFERKSNTEKLQNDCIDKAENDIGLENLDSQARGNYAEMKVDRDLEKKGYERISNEAVTDLETPTGPGIDGVYTNKKTGETLIVETKFNKSELGNTLDGKQMSEAWIDNRLDSAVGKETADNIRMNSILNPDSVKSVLAKVDLNGITAYSKLDSAANIIGGIEL